MNPESLSVVSGVLMSYVTEYLKRAEWFKPVSAGQRGRIQALSGLLNAVIAVVLVWGTSGFDSGAVNGLIQSALVCLQSFGVSFGHYELFLNKGSNEPQA